MNFALSQVSGKTLISFAGVLRKNLSRYGYLMILPFLIWLQLVLKSPRGFSGCCTWSYSNSRLMLKAQVWQLGLWYALCQLTDVVKISSRRQRQALSKSGQDEVCEGLLKIRISVTAKPWQKPVRKQITSIQMLSICVAKWPEAQ